MLSAPSLDIVLYVGPHEGRIEGDSHLPQPNGRPSTDGAQDTIGLPEEGEQTIRGLWEDWAEEVTNGKKKKKKKCMYMADIKK